MKQNQFVSLLIVDDHQIMIDGIKALLKAEKNLNIIGEVLNGHDALTLLKKNSVDIVITDISMPDMSGIDLTKNIKKNHPFIKVIVLTMHNEPTLIKDILESGASGYLLKNIGQNELVEAIQKIAAGGTYYSSEVVDIVMSGIAAKNEKTTVATLTKREIEILKLIAKGCSNEKIANTLFISELTVETHRKNIFKKTNTKGVAALLNYAYEHKLIS